jgi:hypothetical protein
LLIGRYSAGDPVSSLVPEFPEVLKAIEATALPQSYRTEPFYVDELDTYVYAMWLLSLCKLLRIDPLLPRVAALFDVSREDNRGKDALFEALLAKLGLASEPAKGMLKNRKAHQLLFQAIEAEPKKKSLYVAEFLKSWYPAMKGTYWHDRHRRVPQNFFGYWALEAGLVTYLWDIDDQGYRDLPFYPKDLVDYARQHPEVDTTALGNLIFEAGSPGSVKAGQPCPRDGYWSTLAKPGSRRRFALGDILPAFDSAFGTTVWHWDANQVD